MGVQAPSNPWPEPGGGACKGAGKGPAVTPRVSRAPGRACLPLIGDPVGRGTATTARPPGPPTPRPTPPGTAAEAEAARQAAGPPHAPLHPQGPPCRTELGDRGEGNPRSRAARGPVLPEATRPPCRGRAGLLPAAPRAAGSPAGSARALSASGGGAAARSPEGAGARALRAGIGAPPPWPPALCAAPGPGPSTPPRGGGGGAFGDPSAPRPARPPRLRLPLPPRALPAPARPASLSPPARPAGGWTQPPRCPSPAPG